MNNEDGLAHLCLMANDSKEDAIVVNSKEILSFLSSCSKDESVTALFDIFQIIQG